MPEYDAYNREERAICSHLFRLLHKNLDIKDKSPLGQFLNILFQQELTFENGTPTTEILNFDNVAIYCEMAMIRDAYFSKKNNVDELKDFMDNLTKLIMHQEGVTSCRLYSQLPEPLNNIAKTHPKQIRRKAEQVKIDLSENEKSVYGAMQGMFNAKPDLVITIDNLLLVCEAKFTEKFDQEQLERTWNIAEVWSTLLYKDLGFNEPPTFTVFKLGALKNDPHICWCDIYEIADGTYPEHDRTWIALKSGIELLDNCKF